MSDEHAPTITLDQALRRLRELEAVARMARPIVATVALRPDDSLRARAAVVLTQLDALRL